MELFLIIGGTFLLCFLVDKGFTKLFRSAPQHASGKSVRLNKYLGVGGLLLAVLGIAAILTGIGGQWLLLGGGILVLLLGIALMVYYLTFGIYYDEESFLLTTFGKKSEAYRYHQIRNQQIFINGGQVLVELYLADGRAVQLQSSMAGAYAFLDAAFAGWCKQKGIDPESCEFHDPANSCWFPPVEG